MPRDVTSDQEISLPGSIFQTQSRMGGIAINLQV